MLTASKNFLCPAPPWSWPPPRWVARAAPTTFTFLLRPIGLVPVAEDGLIRYNDVDTGETVFTTSPFYVYDSSATPNSYFDTDFTLESPMDGIYVLTVTLDADYMATEGLTYPIYVDPTVSYVSQGNVETVTVYSGSTKSNTACGNEMEQYVGYRDGTYSQGRMLVRINALKDNEVNKDLTEKIYSKECIYGDDLYSDKVLNNLSICEGCRRKILENITFFDHE